MFLLQLFSMYNIHYLLKEQLNFPLWKQFRSLSLRSSRHRRLLFYLMFFKVLNAHLQDIYCFNHLCSQSPVHACKINSLTFSLSVTSFFKKPPAQRKITLAESRRHCNAKSHRSLSKSHRHEWFNPMCHLNVFVSSIIVSIIFAHTLSCACLQDTHCYNHVFWLRTKPWSSWFLKDTWVSLWNIQRTSCHGRRPTFGVASAVLNVKCLSWISKRTK